MAMDTIGSGGIDGETDELVLQDEIRGSDNESDDSSIQVLEDDEDGTNEAEAARPTSKKGRQKPAKMEAEDKNVTTTSMETGELAFDSFVVDTEAVEDEANNSAFQPDDRETSARFSFAQVISHHTPVPKEPRRNDRNSGGKTCFNCGTIGHELNKCPEPRDARRISQNRNLFGRRRESGGARFHEQRQGPQPGVVSDALREALGIGSRDLPPWIYRMRKLGLLNGYPPAYRNRATERLTVKFHMEEDVTSTVGHQRKRKHAEISGEDDQCQIKSEKLIRYPGFNYVDDNYADRDSHSWRVPPWDTFVKAQQHHVDMRRRQQKQNDGATGGETAAAIVPKKRQKKSEEEVEEGQMSEDETDAEGNAMSISEEEGEQYDDNEEEDKEEDNVLYVDASRTKKRRKTGAVDQSLEEGEILDDESAEEEKEDMDLRMRTNGTKATRKRAKEEKVASSAVNVTMRRERRKDKTATVPPQNVGSAKRKRKDAVTPAAVPAQKASSSSALVSSTALTAVVAKAPPAKCPSTAEKGRNDDDVDTAMDKQQQQQQKTDKGEATDAVVLLKQMQLGTPVPLTHHFCEDKPDYAVEKPDLQKWSIGIQAFQHQPPASSTGFFKRMHQIVKSVRKSGAGTNAADGDKDKTAANGQQKPKSG